MCWFKLVVHGMLFVMVDVGGDAFIYRYGMVNVMHSWAYMVMLSLSTTPSKCIQIMLNLTDSYISPRPQWVDGSL